MFAMDTERLEAFSDGVLAVIITIMVLELHPPKTATGHSFVADSVPGLVLYALSFVFVGIYWNNHHHMLRASKGMDGRAMWANLHLLFWLSLVAFATEWLGAHPFERWPTCCYSGVLFLDSVAYRILQLTLLRVNGARTPFAAAVAIDTKGTVSIALSILAIAAAFFAPAASYVLLVVVAVMWVIPDRRFEPLIDHAGTEPTRRDE